MFSWWRDLDIFVVSRIDGVGVFFSDGVEVLFEKNGSNVFGVRWGGFDNWRDQISGYYQCYDSSDVSFVCYVRVLKILWDVLYY